MDEITLHVISFVVGASVGFYLGIRFLMAIVIMAEANEDVERESQNESAEIGGESA